jgi:hypothetical protein
LYCLLHRFEGLGLKHANDRGYYFSLKLEDPSFNGPIFANLFDDEDGEAITLRSRVTARRRLTDRRRPLERAAPPAAGQSPCA